MKMWRALAIGTFVVTLNILFIQCSPLQPISSQDAMSSMSSTSPDQPGSSGGGGGGSATPTPTLPRGVSPSPSPTPRPTPIPTVPPSNGAANYFPAGNLWTSDISDSTTHPKDADSDTVIAKLASLGGWGMGAIRMDMSLKVLTVDATTPKLRFTSTAGVEGDPVPIFNGVPSLPIPTWGSLEGETGYQCTHGGDCHLILHDTSANKLYETWATNSANNVFTAAILVVWDLTKNYPVGRGDGCTSSDAAGFPIAPLLFSADEIAAGSLNHAIRFTLPNNRWRNSAFVHPATHSGGGKNGNTTGVLYGSRFRLKASKDISGLSAPAQVVARAMKKYGMFAADGGNITLTAMSDTYTTHKWSEFPQPADPRFAPIDLSSLLVTDFEIVNDGRGTGSGYDCVRVYP